MIKWRSPTVKTHMYDTITYVGKEMKLEVCTTKSGRHMVIRGEDVMYNGTNSDDAWAVYNKTLEETYPNENTKM